MLSLFCGNELDKYDVINYLLEQAGKCKLKFDIHEAVIDFKPGDSFLFFIDFYLLLHDLFFLFILSYNISQEFLSNSS